MKRHKSLFIICLFISSLSWANDFHEFMPKEYKVTDCFERAMKSDLEMSEEQAQAYCRVQHEYSYNNDGEACMDDALRSYYYYGLGLTRQQAVYKCQRWVKFSAFGLCESTYSDVFGYHGGGYKDGEWIRDSVRICQSERIFYRSLSDCERRTYSPSERISCLEYGRILYQSRNACENDVMSVFPPLDLRAEKFCDRNSAEN